MARIAHPCVALLVGLAVAVPAVPVAAGTAPQPAESRRKPPVTQTEQVTAVVPAGLLVVSVALPRRYRDDGRTHETAPLEVVVRDSRPGTPGWSLGGIARNFTEQGGTPSASDQIRWTPRLVAAPGAGVSVTPSGLGDPIEGDPGSVSRQLAVGAAARSFGTTVVAVGLSVPLTAEESLFAGDLTFTVL